MKNSLLAILFGTGLFMSGCTKYLDVVPDNTLKLENIFNLREDALDALAKVYSYMPEEDVNHNSTWYLGHEYMVPIPFDTYTYRTRGIRIMRGIQSASSPLISYWTGINGGKPLYQGIRQVEVFLENIGGVKDMTEKEKNEWSAQAKFLKAYYAFLLMRQYGPIVLMKEVATPESTKDELFIPRSTVDEGFDFILNLLDESIPYLKEQVGQNELGQIDQVGALAIKARILLFRASPFFNGNVEFYGDFVNKEGAPLFPLNVSTEKWKEALDAVNTAILLAEQNGKRLYRYGKNPYIYDRVDYSENTERMKTLYDLRMVVCDPWNEELLWGQSRFAASGNLAAAAAIRLPEGYGDGLANSPSYSFQWLSASYNAAERYYSSNGVPISEDQSFDMINRFEVVNLPAEQDRDFQQYRGYMQPGAETVGFYLNREPRFYANLGITGGYWRGHGVRINTMMYQGTDAGYDASKGTDYFATGIGIQKLVHPESKSGGWERMVRYPLPLIRLADLYLMRAEIINEYQGPGQEVYDDLNKVRRRAGLPDVEQVWSDGSIVRTVNRHASKEGLREIILEERANEFAFEGGSHFWDVWRYKKAEKVFSAPIWGWNHEGKDGATFFQLQVKQDRQFSITNYLWPIDINEMNTNSKLIQNPGW